MRNAATYVLIAVATVAARLPFLLRADRFFDSDEAVEGLMARHVSHGELPMFLWGQRYKGVPEIYLSSAAFQVAGPSVVVLKAVTLACFVVFLCLNFRLLERLFSRAVAAMTTAFFVVGPPSLVLWTLSGSAEIVVTLLAGVVLLLAVDWWRRSPSSRAPVLAGAALGFGLWVQQYIVFYAVALAITAAITMPGFREKATAIVRDRIPGWIRAGLLLLTLVSAAYVLLGLLAFFAGGFEVRMAGVRVTASHPQKMWWIAGALLGVTAMVMAAAVFRRALMWPAIGFVAGYAPALLGRVSNSGMGAPIARMDFAQLRAALPDITTVMLPMLIGFRDPSARPTVFPVLAAVLVVLTAWSFWHARRLKLMPFFHIFILVAPVMFLVSGSYVDAQTYRYLMPMYAALPVVYAIGIDGVRRSNVAAGALLLVVVLLLFAAQQAAWYRRLEPDHESAATIACLDRSGARVARAGYWRSYKITFLTGERIVVAPADGVDRYPPYSALAKAGSSLDAASCFGR